MNDIETSLIGTSCNQLQLDFRPVTEDDAVPITNLVKANFAAFPDLTSYYSQPSAASWKKALISGGSDFLGSYVLADAVVDNRYFSPAGFARIYRFPANGQECAYITGPWIDSSIGEERARIIAHIIATRTLEKVQELGLPVARARVPCCYPPVSRCSRTLSASYFSKATIRTRVNRQ